MDQTGLTGTQCFCERSKVILITKTEQKQKQNTFILFHFAMSTWYSDYWNFTIPSTAETTNKSIIIKRTKTTKQKQQVNKNNSNKKANNNNNNMNNNNNHHHHHQTKISNPEQSLRAVMYYTNLNMLIFTQRALLTVHHQWYFKT